MEIENISHKALKRFFLTGNSKGLVGDVERLRAMLAFIAATASLDELAKPPNYGLHRLTGNRADTWSMTVTRNWRLTFTVTLTATVTDLNLEDYHGS
jgi:toxin HigB-1